MLPFPSRGVTFCVPVAPGRCVPPTYSLHLSSQKLSGFVCCHVGSVECHSRGNRGGFNPHRNRVVSFLSRFAAPDAAYFLDTYVALRLHLR